jgi:hypothetical protein
LNKIIKNIFFMILQNLLVFFIFLIRITFNEIDQRFHIYIKYFSYNNVAFCEIVFKNFFAFFISMIMMIEMKFISIWKENLFWFEKKLAKKLQIKLENLIIKSNRSRKYRILLTDEKMNCYCCLFKMNEKFILLYKKSFSFIYLLIFIFWFIEIHLRIEIFVCH